MLDLLYIVLTLALFAGLTLVVGVLDRLLRRGEGQ